VGGSRIVIAAGRFSAYGASSWLSPIDLRCGERTFFGKGRRFVSGGYGTNAQNETIRGDAASGVCNLAGRRCSTGLIMPAFDWTLILTERP